MKTTFSRNFFTYAIILLSALLLVGLSSRTLVQDYLNDQAVDGLKHSCSTIARMAEAYYTEEGLTGKEFLMNLSVASDVAQANTLVCDQNGQILLCSDDLLGCTHQGMRLNNASYLQRVKNQEFVVSTGSIQGLYQEQRYVVSTAIRDQGNGAFLGLVMVSSPTTHTVAVMERLSDTFLFVSVLVVVAAFVVMTVYARRASTPLRDMAKTAIAFGHGDLKARTNVSEKSPEEIRELGLAFNNMAQSLEKSEYQRQEFVANVSHELKTPMTTIGGYIDGILDGTIPPEQQAHYLRIASDETKRLSRLVRSMLDISRLQESAGVPEERKTRFDAGECVGRVLVQFERKILEKTQNVRVELPEHPVYTLADQDAITQVIYNLLDNAIKFCPPDGELGVTMGIGGNKLYVTVSNEGNTIPPEELPLVFDRFHKLDKSRSENREGWGLGLYIVKTIVCSHGEDISVSSENGMTRFTFTLPLVN